MNAILSLRGVSKRFGDSTVLHEIDLEIARGEFVILMGGSGSGKTTLLRIASGLERTDSGSVHLRGIEMDVPASGRFVPPERRGLGMVFQDYALWPHMTCVENIAAVLPSRDRNRTEAALDYLRNVGLIKLAQRRPAQLSGGQQQRVGLARALAVRPELLLLDEPLSGLDVGVRDRMRRHIRELVRESGAAALFVSHDPVDVWRLADRVIVLDSGRIAQSDTPERLYACPRTHRVARMMGFESKLPVSLLRNGDATGFACGGRFQPATLMGPPDGRDAVALVRPEGVRTSGEGHDAIRLDSTFEAGRWRTRWRIPALDWTLYGLQSEAPRERVCLTIDPDHLFVFTRELDPQHD